MEYDPETREVSLQDSAHTKAQLARRQDMGRIQGIAAALAALVDAHSSVVEAADVLNNLGLMLHDLRAAHADAYDMKILERWLVDRGNDVGCK